MAKHIILTRFLPLHLGATQDRIFCMEATSVYGVALAEYLHQSGEKVIVANPTKTHALRSYADFASLHGCSLVGSLIDMTAMDGGNVDFASLHGCSLVGSLIDMTAMDGGNVDFASLHGCSLVDNAGAIVEEQKSTLSSRHLDFLFITCRSGCFARISLYIIRHLPLRRFVCHIVG